MILRRILMKVSKSEFLIFCYDYLDIERIYQQLSSDYRINFVFLIRNKASHEIQ